MIWFCLWILSIIGISFWGGTVSYGFFVTLTLIPLFSLGYLLFVYFFFHIYQNIENRYVVVNETVPFHFSLVNEYFLLFAGIRVRFFTSFSTINELSDETEYELLPKTGIEKETTIVCHYRGQYDVGIEKIEIQDFFRLFQISYRNKECISAVVKPQLVKVERLGNIDLVNTMKDSKSRCLELDIASREYVFGDEARLINWSQTARTGILMTRNQIGQDYQDVTILMDTFRKSKEPLEFIPVENKILETTLAIAYYLSRNYISAAEYHYDQGLKRFSTGSENQFDEFYDSLSKVSFDDRNMHELLYEAITQRREIFQSSMVFMVVSSFGDEAQKLLHTFEENNIHTVICFISDDSKEIPDLSNDARADLIQISPYADLAEVMEE